MTEQELNRNEVFINATFQDIEALRGVRRENGDVPILLQIYDNLHEWAAIGKDRLKSIEKFQDQLTTLQQHNALLRRACEIAAKAELYDPATGIIDADVLDIVQEEARKALEATTLIEPKEDV